MARTVRPVAVGATPGASAVPGGRRKRRRPFPGHGTIPAHLTCRYMRCLGCRPGPVRPNECVRGEGVGTGRRGGVRGSAAGTEGTHGPQLRLAGPPSEHEHLHAAPLLCGRGGPPRLRPGGTLRRPVRGVGHGTPGTPPPLARGRHGTATAANGRDGGGGDGDRAGSGGRRGHGRGGGDEGRVRSGDEDRGGGHGPAVRRRRHHRRRSAAPGRGRRHRPTPPAGPHPPADRPLPRPWYRRKRVAGVLAVACALLGTVGTLAALPDGHRSSPDGRDRATADSVPTASADPTAPGLRASSPPASASPSSGRPERTPDGPGTGREPSGPAASGDTSGSAGGSGSKGSSGGSSEGSATPAGTPLAWTVDSQAWAFGCGHDYVVAKPPAQVPPPRSPRTPVPGRRRRRRCTEARRS